MTDFREIMAGPRPPQAPTEYPEGGMYLLVGAAALGILNVVDAARDRFDEIVDGRIVAETQKLETGHARYQALTSVVDVTVKAGGQGEKSITVARNTPALDIYRKTVVKVTPAEYGTKPYISADRVVTDGLFEHITSRYNQTRNPRSRNTLSVVGVLRSVVHARRAQKSQARQEQREMKEAAVAPRHIFSAEGNPLI